MTKVYEISSIEDLQEVLQKEFDIAPEEVEEIGKAVDETIELRAQLEAKTEQFNHTLGMLWVILRKHGPLTLTRAECEAPSGKLIGIDGQYLPSGELRMSAVETPMQ